MEFIPELPNSFKKAIIIIAQRLGKNRKWAIRGTTSLLLQGIQMKAEDIDILCDKKTALECNRLFEEYLIQKVSFRKTKKFTSYFGKFQINQVTVEIMGEWKIKSPKGIWIGPFDVSERHLISFQNYPVWVTTVSSELKMFAAMGRFSAFWKIKSQLKTQHNPS